jgi:hypothetical protein
LGIFSARLVHANISSSRTNNYNLSFGATASLTMSNDESNLGNVIGGTFFGALAGGGLGLGACMFLFDDPPFFTGDTMLIGAIACGVLGFFLGAGFIAWLKENWWGFWW